MDSWVGPFVAHSESHGSRTLASASGYRQKILRGVHAKSRVILRPIPRRGSAGPASAEALYRGVRFNPGCYIKAQRLTSRPFIRQRILFCVLDYSPVRTATCLGIHPLDIAPAGG